MKANQKGDTSPYDFARRSGSCGIKILWENFGTRDPGVTFVLRPDLRFSLGDGQLKSPRFVLPLSISRYGIASKQHGNGNDGTQDNTKTGGGTWRGGQLHNGPTTSNHSPGTRTPPR